jgi:hypothetical protein
MPGKSASIPERTAAPTNEPTAGPIATQRTMGPTMRLPEMVGAGRPVRRGRLLIVVSVVGHGDSAARWA